MSSVRFLIYCPVGVKTGGPECLYQLCDALNSLGHDAWIVPTLETAKSEPCRDFDRYSVNYLTNAKILTDDILIVPEVITRIPKWLGKTIKPSNLVIWWLSVDNSPLFPFKAFELQNHEIPPFWRTVVRNGNKKTKYKYKSIPRKTLNYIMDLKFRINYRLSSTAIDLKLSKHYAQSEYAKSVVSEKLGVKVEKLSDYVYGSENRNLPKSKKNNLQKVIAVNPFKGADLFLTFKSLFRDEVIFVELKGMTTEVIAQTLSESDLYLDLGHFPGKDRIPREAILEGCPVLLAKRGAARNEIDFHLSPAFKVDLQTTTPVQLRGIVLGLLADNGLFEGQLDFFHEQTIAKPKFFSEVQNLVDSFIIENYSA
jgi:hypothetical protein